jgi:hypothetical protein
MSAVAASSSVPERRGSVDPDRLQTRVQRTEHVPAVRCDERHLLRRQAELLDGLAVRLRVWFVGLRLLDREDLIDAVEEAR